MKKQNQTDNWIRKAQKCLALCCVVFFPGSFIIWILGGLSIIHLANYSQIGSVMFFIGLVSGALSAFLLDLQKKKS